jgi:transposase
MGQEGVIAQRRRFSAEFKREAVGMLEAPGVSVTQIATEFGIGAAMLGRWRRERRQEAEQAFPGNGRSREEEVVHLKRELARVTKERDFLREAAAFFARASR